MKKAWLTPGLALCASLPHLSQAQATMPKMVWAHYFPVMPNDTRTQYGATYPLTLHMPDDRSDADFQTRFVTMLKNTGINGLSFEINPQAKGKAPGLPAYEKMVAFLQNSNITVAPCIDAGYYPGIDNDMFNMIVGSYNISQKYSNPAIQRDGRLIVFFYGSRNLPAGFWMNLRQRLSAAGYKIFLAGDIGVANEAPAQKMAIASHLAPNWDAAYNFSSAGMGNSADSNRNFSLNIGNNSRFWINSVMPGYFRGRLQNGLFTGFGTDPLGTQRLTNYWNDFLNSGSPWVYFSTANDFIEHTNLLPDSTWGYTRSDINLWYARKFLGQAYPFQRAFYLTTPQILYPGDKSSIELSAINPTNQFYSLTYSVTDSQGKTINSGIFSAKPADLSTLRISIPQPGLNPSQFYRVKVRGDGVEILSAPVLFHTMPRGGDRAPFSYYSVSNRLFSPRFATASVQWNGGNVAVNNLNISDILSVDLLMNGNLADQAKLPTTNPILSINRNLVFDRNTNDNTMLQNDSRKYVVRIVYRNGFIWYSDPYIR
ncbi:hypothetical protein [Novosphingobium sp. KACC 22771]|uniref:hypothetical protein n=1 Tax=Novosphingobium sp. KACC 22771 TaxID=3025670 RepID=UPI002366F0FD|nr:hypothetical protein [Novosphingobium sp. KACC 22771]WDF72858.1 hypothetical protein PQ467_02110 [Novosphingobium sp. KACC 22771]